MKNNCDSTFVYGITIKLNKLKILHFNSRKQKSTQVI